MTRIIGPSGIEMDIDDNVAAGLVDGGHARYVTEAPAEDMPRNGASPATTLGDPDNGTGQGPASAEPLSLEAPAEDKPKGNASLDVWAAYATARGKDITGLNRDEIRALFKE